MDIIDRIDEARKDEKVRGKLHNLDATIDDFMDMLEDQALMIEDNPTFQQQVLQLLADTTKEHGEFIMSLKRVAQALDSKSGKLGKIKPVGKQVNPYGSNGSQQQQSPQDQDGNGEMEEIADINEAENPLVKKGKNVAAVMVNLRKELEDAISNMSGLNLAVSANNMTLLLKTEKEYIVLLTKILKGLKK